MTLHDAIARAFETTGNSCMSPAEIAKAVNARGEYHRKDGNPVPSGQVSARMNNYRDRFERCGRSWCLRSR